MQIQVDRQSKAAEQITSVPWPCCLLACQHQTYRPLSTVGFGAPHVHWQLEHKFIIGEPLRGGPFEFVHCIRKREVFVLLRTLDEERPSPVEKQNGDRKQINSIEVELMERSFWSSCLRKTDVGLISVLGSSAQLSSLPLHTAALSVLLRALGRFASSLGLVASCFEK